MSENYVSIIKMSLETETIIEKKKINDVRPMISAEYFDEIENLVKADPDFIKACARRGISDMSLVCVDPWSSAGSWKEHEETEKDFFVSHTFAWVRSKKNDNHYAHPIEGVNAVVDISSLKILRVDDYHKDDKDIIPIPKIDNNYEDQGENETYGFKPIIIQQPQGVSFCLNRETHEINWFQWSMIIGFNAREGLTLHDIKFAGRPLLYRVSLAEMVVPYGTPEYGHYRKNVFDIGEYGLGKLANSLKLACDCLGSIEYLDAHIVARNGDLVTIQNAICIHEEDNGLAWKHYDFRTERTDSRRARKLVISFIATVGNYDYALYYYFHVDGTFECEVKATGIINTTACIPYSEQKYGAEVSPGVLGHIHQHIFCARLDLAIDGDSNSVVQIDTLQEPAASPQNPWGNAYYHNESLLEFEQGCDENLSSMRYWKFINSNKRNAVDKPTAYKLEPTSTVTPMVQPFSLSGRRAAFTMHPLWITPYDKTEYYPAGDFMNHSDGSSGLAAYVAKKRPIVNKDIVAWINFGVHHIPRPEDFPVQPCISTGFKLMPSGFFDRNPCLDLPKTSASTSTLITSSSSCCTNGTNGITKNGTTSHE